LTLTHNTQRTQLHAYVLKMQFVCIFFFASGVFRCPCSHFYITPPEWVLWWM